MDKLMLKIVLAFAKIFIKKDVDFEKLKIITETKLLMDRRRVRVTMKKQTDTEPKNQVLLTHIIYGIFGMVFGVLIMNSADIVLGMILMHTYILFMMAMTLITDFSTVMLDTTDNQIILPRPVNSKTLFTARLVHILVYLLQFTIALALFPILFTFIRFGLAVGLGSIVTVLLTVGFAVFLTYLLYGLIMRFAGEEKIKDIVSWFQIVLTVFFAVGYQVLPRLIDLDALNRTFTLHTYSYFLPPVWMGLTIEGVYLQHFDKLHLLMALLSFAVPLFCFWLMIKFLAPSFAKRLASLGNTNDAAPDKNAKVYYTKKSYGDKLSALVSINKTEEAGFDLTWKMTARDRSFKMQFYPSLAYLLVFAFVFVFKSGKDIFMIWRTLADTKSFLWFVYLPMFSISSAIGLIAFNENFTASWVYLSSPLHQPGSLISGALKSLLVKFFMPVFLVLFAFCCYIWGFQIIDDFIFGLFNNILIFLLMAHFGNAYLPFSMQPNAKQQTGKLVKMILQLIIIALLVGLHYLALKFVWAVPALIPVSAAAVYFMLRVVQNYSWQKIAS
jgi:ABC-2 type transport system permease protein